MHIVNTANGLATLTGGEVAIRDLPYADVSSLLAAGGQMADIEQAPVVRRTTLDDPALEMRASVGSVGTIWGVGLNYASKILITGREAPKVPTMFVVTNACVADPGAALVYPDGCTEELDYEGEIAVLIGAPLYRADARETWAAVAGITAANDVTARDVMRVTGQPTLAKSFAGCKPFGASLIPRHAMQDADAVTVRTSVNGAVVQDDSSAGLLWGIAELLSRISWFAPLAPGDVLLTGTPAGTGQDRGIFLQPGDIVTVEVGDALPLTTRVVAPDAH